MPTQEQMVTLQQLVALHNVAKEVLADFNKKVLLNEVINHRNLPDKPFDYHSQLATIGIALEELIYTTEKGITNIQPAE